MAEPSRRAVLFGVALLAVAAAPPALAWDFSFQSIEEGTLKLADFRGRVLLVTNTATFCSYTYQFRGLQALYDELSPKGLTVVCVPSQDLAEESSSNATVKSFCETTFGVTFPMAGITHVRGPDAAAFYGWVRATRGWEPDSNFDKVLIGRDGAVAGLFGPDDEPDGAKLRGAIIAALAAAA